MYTHTKETQESLSPADALQILKEGNERFSGNLKANRNLLQQVNETRDGQWPFAAILSCIDSRTSAELIFDQGLGDIFSARIAGNVVNTDILGSLEFACQIAGAKLVVVVGHSRCGAVKGACDGIELGYLTKILRKISPAVEAVRDPVDPDARTSANAEFVEAVCRENVRHVVDAISERSSVLLGMQATGAIDIVGAMYDVSVGSVDFLPKRS
ncbi:MAG: carbonic anhydrase [Deltaproteobacteria bacterium]|nr:carbonic anhydrase [Deltaproteobacteria bacterium]